MLDEEQKAPTPLTVGDLVSILYPQLQEIYGDDERASVETAMIVNRVLTHQNRPGDTPLA